MLSEAFFVGIMVCLIPFVLNQQFVHVHFALRNRQNQLGRVERQCTHRATVAADVVISIVGVVNVDFPVKNDSSFAKISYNPSQTTPYTLYQNIQSIGYKINPHSDSISSALLRVQGMHCNSCVMNITGTVEDLPGVHYVKVSFDDQSADVRFDGTIIQLSTIIDEIQKLDFQVAIALSQNDDNACTRLTTSLQAGRMTCVFLLVRESHRDKRVLSISVNSASRH